MSIKMLEWTEVPWLSKGGEAGYVTQGATREERHQHLICITGQFRSGVASGGA